MSDAASQTPDPAELRKHAQAFYDAIRNNDVAVMADMCAKGFPLQYAQALSTESLPEFALTHKAPDAAWWLLAHDVPPSNWGRFAQNAGSSFLKHGLDLALKRSDTLPLSSYMRLAGHMASSAGGQIPKILEGVLNSAGLKDKLGAIESNGREQLDKAVDGVRAAGDDAAASLRAAAAQARVRLEQAAAQARKDPTVNQIFDGFSRFRNRARDLAKELRQDVTDAWREASNEAPTGSPPPPPAPAPASAPTAASEQAAPASEPAVKKAATKKVAPVSAASVVSKRAAAKKAPIKRAGRSTTKTAPAQAARKSTEIKTKPGARKP